MGELDIWNTDGFQCVCESHTPGGIGDYYQEQICPECKLGYLSGHPTLEKWLKCGLCGFCVRESLSPAEVSEILKEEAGE